MDSIVGLIIQFVGIFLIATLFVFLRNSLDSCALRYWKMGWIALSIALLSLYIAFHLQNFPKPFLVPYYLGEYIFAFLLIGGCRNYIYGETLTVKNWMRILTPASAVTVFLAFPVSDFNHVFQFHSFIMGIAFAAAFFTLLRTKQTSQQKNSGLRIMQVALALLSLDFFHYTLLFSLLRAGIELPLPQNYLAYNPIIDLVLEILLGFGMIIALMERVRLEIEETNHKLKDAHDQLEKLAHIDPLTAAFTRHAFYGFLKKHGKEDNTISGCVGVFDIDNLKPINDRFGHAAGDVAISTTAHAIRSLIRADDLIFRWGGDEFFVVMLGFSYGQAQARMSELNSILTDVNLHGLSQKISIKVSFGFAAFEDISQLETAVKIADARMYEAKQANKLEQETDKIPYSPIQNSPNQIPTELF